MKKTLIVFCFLSFLAVIRNSNAQSWVQLNTGVNSTLLSVFFVNESVGYACGTDGTIIKTINGGVDWESLITGTTSTLRDVYFINSDTGFVVGGKADGGEGIVLTTYNGGINWYSNKVCNQIITGVQFVNSTTGFITAGYGCSTGLFKTIDLGATWTSVSNPNSLLWNHGLFFVNDQVGYIIGSYEKVIKTVNGGTSWSGSANMSSPNHLVHGVHFIDEDIGFVGGVSGIKKTTNGGGSWNLVSSYGYRVKFVTREIGYFINETNLYKSSDTGDTWDSIASFPFGANNLFFVNENLGFACGSQGMMVRIGEVCRDIVLNDTATYFVSSPEFEPISFQSFYISTDSSHTHIGGCDSIIHHYVKFIYNPTFCTVTDTNYVTMTETVYTAVTDTLIIDAMLTGMTPPNNVNTLLIYPNPSSSHIFINNGDYTLMADYTISIINNLGQVVFTSFINQEQFYIDLSTLSGNGLYFVKIADNLGNVIETKKIIIQ